MSWVDGVELVGVGFDLVENLAVDMLNIWKGGFIEDGLRRQGESWFEKWWGILNDGVK